MDTKQLSLDELDDGEPEDWHDWFMNLPRTPSDLGCVDRQFASREDQELQTKVENE